MGLISASRIRLNLHVKSDAIETYFAYLYFLRFFAFQFWISIFNGHSMNINTFNPTRVEQTTKQRTCVCVFIAFVCVFTTVYSHTARVRVHVCYECALHTYVLRTSELLNRAVFRTQIMCQVNFD